MNDEVLQKDEFLGGAQILQHPLPARTAVGKVLGRGVLVHGIALPLQVAALPIRTVGGGGRLRFLGQIPYAVVIEELTAPIQGAAELLFGSLPARDEEDDAAEEGKNQNGYDPSHLDLGVPRAVDDVDDRRQADEIEAKGDGKVVGREVEEDEEQPRQLDGDAQSDQHHAGKEFAEDLHGRGSFR